MAKNSDKYNINDFTIDNYRRLLEIAKRNYKFIHYEGFRSRQNFILWRHDVDLSPHRALKLAKVENEAQISATYFLHLQSQFYNLFEPEITAIIRDIMSLGHIVGLHFDATGRNVLTYDDLKKYLKIDKNILENMFGQKVGVFSFHNPTLLPFPVPGKMKIAGMINTYCDYLKENVKYCSDSNGYWRFERLEEVLSATSTQPLQVLTHPGWWTDEPLMPRQRVHRCIDGRAKKVSEDYDKILSASGRENIS